MTPPHRKERPPDDLEPPELTDEDIRWVREQRKQDAHAKWLRGQIKILWPYVAAVLGTTVAVLTWIRDHVRL